MYLACPFGERREDIRTAYMTAHVLASTRSDAMPDDEFREMWRVLRQYLACEQPQESDDSKPNLDALALMQAKEQNATR